MEKFDGNAFTEKPDDEEVVAEDGGIQLQFDRNIFQLMVIVLFVVIGAFVGSTLTKDRPDIAALAGGVVGMIIGAFISGFVLMLLPLPEVTMTLDEIRTNYRLLKKRLKVALIASVISTLTLMMAFSLFSDDDSTLAWVICSLAIGVDITLLIYHVKLGSRLTEWKCPGCGISFGEPWSTCNNCGLSIDMEGEE